MDSVWRRNKPPKFTTLQKWQDFELRIAPKHSKQFGLTWKLYHNKYTSRGTKSNKFYWKWAMDEGDTRPRSCSPKMQFGELKLKLWTSIGFQKINTSWIDLKILPYKLEGRMQLFQQVLLNLDLECKIYSTLNWTWNSVRTLSVLFVTLGLTP